LQRDLDCLRIGARIEDRLGSRPECSARLSRQRLEQADVGRQGAVLVGIGMEEGPHADLRRVLRRHLAARQQLEPVAAAACNGKWQSGCVGAQCDLAQRHDR
jgi:hypothetical protein